MTAVLLLCLLGGCSGAQSALDPQGPQAAQLAKLFWIFTAVCAAVWFAVMLVLLVGLVRRRPARPDPLRLDPRTERRSLAVVGGAVVATLLTVIALTALSYLSQRQLYARERPAVTIKVTGQQWWWDVRYEADAPGQTVTTANEIYIPVGQPVTVKLAATDVIHSFWVPSLAGKKDLIPGRTATMSFRADQPGRYRGQCAEFCGYQHAFMAFEVIVDPPATYDAWANAQRTAPPEPADKIAQRGRDVFLGSTCIMCHAIEGTTAAARKGPDLSHVGGRSTIAAGTLPNRPAELARWIANPQDFKPGVNMPATPLSSDDMTALVAYLGSLK
jgi:cytochrome c oxidase subunit 2